MQTTFHLFVYGSLRSGFKSPAYNYISKYFTLICPATVHGQLFDMGTYPVATATNTNNLIIGELYSINNTDEFSFAIAQLDDYEGVNAEEDETLLFSRQKVLVHHHDNKTTEAWIYWYIGDVTNLPIVAGGDVLAYYAEKLNAH